MITGWVNDPAFCLIQQGCLYAARRDQEYRVLALAKRYIDSV